MCENTNVGKVLKGFCNGYFGRDSYDDKVIEEEGRDWIVVRGQNSIPVIATFRDEYEKDEMIKKWLSKSPE